MNETWLDEHTTDSIVNINCYSIVRNDRNREGGGVAMYYRNCTNTALNDLIPEDIDLEAICIEVMQVKSKPILIASVYRPPNMSTEIFEKIEILMQNLDQENKEVSGGSSVSQNKLPQLTLGYIYILKYFQKLINNS